MLEELITQLVEQALDVAQQIVVVGRISSLLELLGCLVGIICVLLAFRITDKRVNARDWDGEAWILVGLGGVVALLICLWGGVEATDAAVKSWFAPKLYLLEYLSNLIKK